MPLTDTAIRNAKAPEKPCKLSDGGGLHLLIQLNGSKLWRLAYRWAGKQKTIALGTYPAVSLAKARKGRDSAKRLLADGQDPAVQKRREKLAAKASAGSTFKCVALECLEKQRSAVTSRYADLVLHRLQLDIFPSLGARPIADVDAPEPFAVLQKVENRGAIEQARRHGQICSQVFRHAIVTGRALYDPAVALRGALKSKGRQQHHRAMPRSDLPGFLKALDNYDGDPRTAGMPKAIALGTAATISTGRWRPLPRGLSPSASDSNPRGCPPSFRNPTTSSWMRS